MPVLPSDRNQSIDLLWNQSTGFHLRATLEFDGLNKKFQCIPKKELLTGLRNGKTCDKLFAVRQQQVFSKCVNEDIDLHIAERSKHVLLSLIKPL